ncbi:16723_t:CDS:2, partial [Racocetra persica]
VIWQEFPHSYKYFDNLSEFEIWHESISENQRTFHEVIRIEQPQKIKINMDGELEKFASYSDPLDRIKKALGQKSFDESLITHIEKDSIELWPYEWEEDKKLKNESVSREESDTAIKIGENQFPFLSYRNSNNGFDIFDRIWPTTCLIYEKEHMREADHNKKKVIPHLDRLRARLQHRSQSYSQNNFTAVRKNIEIYNAKTMHSYNLQAKLTSGNRHLMLIKGHCSIAKSNETAEEIRTLCHFDRSSVSTLIISGWRSLAHGQKVLFEEFKSYLELDAKKLNPKDTPKLIINPESIHKLGATGYDIIILDEFKTITQNFSRSTMKKPKLSHDVYKFLLQSALLILALDATLDSDLLNVELIGALRQGLKVYILMFASAEMAEALHKELESQGYQGKYFSKRLSETEKKEIFVDINNAVANLDYLIATPVMTCEPNASLETHLYNASRRNASKNDFVSLLTDRLSEYSYNINIAKDCPSINSKFTENNEDKELLLQILSDIKALDIREYLEREEDIDPAYRLALQKYNLTSFYRKTSKDITEDFVEKYSQKEIFIVIGDSREKASCDSLLPKVIALEEILQGMSFSS